MSGLGGCIRERRYFYTYSIALHWIVGSRGMDRTQYVDVLIFTAYMLFPAHKVS